MRNSKTKWFISLITIALMFIVVTAVSAQSSIDATLSTGRDNITVGDVIPLTLRVTHPAGWRVIAPTLDRQWGDFEVRGQSTPVITANGDGTETTAQNIDVIRLRPGTTATPALTLAVSDDRGNLTNVDVAPLSITVQSVLIAGDTTLRDIKPQADLITTQRSYWPLLAVGALGVIATIGHTAGRRRRQPVVDKRTPRQRALDTLNAIEARPLPTHAAIDAACADIATCLRDYVTAITSLPAHDLTTNELARQLRTNGIPVDWSIQVIDVLRVCDSVKFARHILELTSIHGLVDAVEIVVKQYPAASQPTPKRDEHGDQSEGNA